MNIQWWQKCFMISMVFVMECPNKSQQVDEGPLDYDTQESKKLRSISSEPGYDFTEEEMRIFKIWPRGIIPFYIDDYSFDEDGQKKIRFLMNLFNSMTGLGFTELSRPPDDSERWVFFVNRRASFYCEEYTTHSFTYTGVQRVVIGYECLNNGEVKLAATILALAGVPPQHNSPDRNRYIDVFIDNAIPEKRHLFEILKNEDWLFHDVDYDFESAGHFDFLKYTVNGSATIKPKYEQTINYPGGNNGLSLNDVWKIRMLYNYISLNRHNAKKSECLKMFKPTGNFAKYNLNSNEPRITPRQKPKKYLGQSTNDDLQDNSEKSDKELDDTTVIESHDMMPETNLKLTITKGALKQKKNIPMKKKKNKNKKLTGPDFDTDYDRKP